MATAVIQHAEVWQPNRGASAALAMLATTLVVAMLISVIQARPDSFDITAPVVQRLTLTLAAPRVELKPQSKQLNVPAPALEPLSVVKPVVDSIPPPIDWQQQIEIEARSGSQMLFLPDRFQDLSPLKQALNGPRKAATMRDGDSYQTASGGVMVKADGMCSEMRSVQVGPSPSNRATVAFPGQACAGAVQPTMAEQLAEWVNQEKKRYPPP